MITANDIRVHLIEKLEPLFGKARDPAALAAMLAKETPPFATIESLTRLADMIIKTRKANSLPPPAQLIRFVRGIPRPSADAGKVGSHRNPNEEREYEEAEESALQSLRGTDIARRAVFERWGPALIQFVIRYKRTPIDAEQRVLYNSSRELDELARSASSSLPLAILRDTMHSKAAKLLGEGEGDVQAIF
jgi:hypothetical protein